jgi:hypothetical protein
MLHEAIPGFAGILAGKAAAGCRIRVAIGDPASPNVLARGEEERYGHGIQARCELALIYYRPLVGLDGVEIRTHATTLYNSIYRADGELLVNTHLWGVNAFGAPVWHLRENQDDTMVSAYRESFDAVWEQATPVA